MISVFSLVQFAGLSASLAWSLKVHQSKNWNNCCGFYYNQSWSRKQFLFFILIWALNWKTHFQVLSFEKTRQTNPSSPLSYASLESTTEETLPKRLKLLQSSCKKRFRILRFNLKSSVTGSCYVGLTSRERGTSEEYFICSLSKYPFF